MTLALSRVSCLAWVVAASVLLLELVAPSQAYATKNVLILAEGPVMPRGADLRAVVVASVRLDPREPLNVYEELIDSSRFEGEEYREQLLDLYRIKYRAVPPDVVVALTEPAMDFTLRYRSDLFPQASLVFGAVDQRVTRTRNLSGDITGVFLQLDARLTVETALSLHPDVRTILVVVGGSRFERGIEEVVRDDLRSLQSRAAITYLSGKPLDQVLAAVASLDRTGLVLFVSLNVDGDGVVRSGPEALANVRGVATVPIYGMSDNFLGHGIVGGVLLDYARHGRELGARVRQILAGERAADLAPTRTTNMLAFDWRELKRFGIGEARLPAGASVVHRELGLWAEYKRTILVVGAVVAGQSLLIGGLLLQRQRRRHAEMAVRDLSGRLISAQEEERRRIARELHDNVSQQIAMLAIRIDQVSATQDEEPAARVRSLRELKQRAVAISTEIHGLSHQLHSTKLEVLGLVEALRGHCEELDAQGIKVHFEHHDVPAALSPGVALCLFRIAQEGMTNVVKHSASKEARVTLRRDGDVLVLRITDRGRGFDGAAGAQGGLGLASIRERVRLLDGEFMVRSQPARGTTLTARVPIRSSGTPATEG